MEELCRFAGRRIDHRLDSGRKPFRKVLRSGDEVIILYDREKTPPSMMRPDKEGRQMPLEWLYYNEAFLSNEKELLPDWPEWLNTYGTVPIHDVGEDKAGNPYIIQRHIGGRDMKEMLSMEYENDRWKADEAMLSFIATFSDCYRIFGNNGMVPMITPENLIFTKQIESGNIVLKLFGIDSILYPEYHDGTLAKYYDTRFLAPWKNNPRAAMKYSTTLTMLTAITRGNNLPGLSDIKRQIVECRHFTPMQVVTLYRCLGEPSRQPESLEEIFKVSEDTRSSKYLS